jgi:hypothetical protein
VSGELCIGEPISWLRLEQLALDELPAGSSGAARAHLAQCPACAAAFASLRDDARPLPALPALPVRAAEAAAPSRQRAEAKQPWWRRWQLAGGLATAAALAIALLLVRSRGRVDRDDALTAATTVRVKGAGDVVVTLVRERAGVIAFDPLEVLPDDRWKVQLTCAPGGAAWVDVAVVQDGRASFPLSAQQLACGNDLVVPGAFRITGGAAEICVALSDRPPARTRLRRGERSGAVCRALRAGPAEPR